MQAAKDKGKLRGEIRRSAAPYSVAHKDGGSHKTPSPSPVLSLKPPALAGPQQQQGGEASTGDSMAVENGGVQ
jgi:hypothetical protein